MSHMILNPVIETVSIASIPAAQDAVRAMAQVLPRGAGTKTALAGRWPTATRLDLRPLRGIVEYNPGEYVFTALAGTPLAEVQAALAEHGQYLPFDPPLAAAGATLGGTVATGLSGSGRRRYGGVRDFIIGMRYVDGQGRLVRSGGKVVKNAAGFDQHKLFVGSLGSLGVIVEVSFKVFPQPPAYTTLQITGLSLADAIDAIGRLSTSHFDLEALDLLPADGAYTLLLRIGGPATVLPARLANLCRWLGRGDAAADDAALWQRAATFGWLPRGVKLAKTPLTLATLPALEAMLASAHAARRYADGGNLAWIAWPGAWDELDAHLLSLGLSGVALLGPPAEQPLLGLRNGAHLAARIKQTLDPDNKFPPLAGGNQ
jgi:glycolate oxidase FAD binding subunit